MNPRTLPDECGKQRIFSAVSVGNPALLFPRPIQEPFVRWVAGAETLLPHPVPACSRVRPPLLGRFAGSQLCGGSRLSPPWYILASQRPSTTDAAFSEWWKYSSIETYQSPHTQADCLLYMVLHLEGRSAVRYFFFLPPKLSFQ